jgi:2-(3-amino-3-carboxypropyl)histidine synthase
LPKNICVATDVQFINNLDSIRKQLVTAGKKVATLKGAHAKHLGQILGCSHLKLDYPKFTEAFLYVGDGLFHPKALLLGSTKDVYVYNPFSKQLQKMHHSEVDKIKKHEKASLIKFLHADKIGVLVSVKPGQIGVQAYLKQIYSLEKKFPDKKFHYLAFDTLEFSQLENFTFIDCFVNTACTRLMDDYDKFPKPMVNIDKVLKLKM